MQTRQTDPIIAEIRAIRQAYAARFDYDVEAIFKDIRASSFSGFRGRCQNFDLYKFRNCGITLA